MQRGNIIILIIPDIGLIFGDSNPCVLRWGSYQYRASTAGLKAKKIPLNEWNFGPWDKNTYLRHHHGVVVLWYNNSLIVMSRAYRYLGKILWEEVKLQN